MGTEAKGHQLRDKNEVQGRTEASGQRPDQHPTQADAVHPTLWSATMSRPSISDTPMTGADAKHAIVPRAQMAPRSFASAVRPTGAAGSSAGVTPSAR